MNKVQNGGTCWDKEPFMKLMSRLCLPMRNRFVKAKAKTAEIYESYQTHWGTRESQIVVHGKERSG